MRCTARLAEKPIKICYNCAHVQLDSVPLCKIFDTKDLAWGTMEYENANSCRYDENKCGVAAKFHKEMSDYECNTRFLYQLRYTFLALSILPVMVMYS